MTNEERAREAVEKVLIDLSDRSGMNLLDQIRWDDPELWKEIIGDGSSIILAALDAATAPLVAERERLIARVEMVETWNAGTVTPRLDVGWEREFIVAVKRAHNGKVYSFAASYLNAYPLRYEYECPKGEGCPRDGCENGCPTTGWFRLTGDDDDGRLYQQLELNEGDELLGWRDVPQWSALAEKEPG